MRMRTAVGCAVSLTLLASAAGGWRYAQRMMDPSTGIAAILPRLLPGMEMNNGRLDPKRPTPFVLDSRYVAALGDLISAETVEGTQYPDSFIVVDTSTGMESMPARMGARIVLTSDDFVLNLYPFKPRRIPYRALLPEEHSVVFTEDGVARLLKGRFGQIALYGMLQIAVSTGFNVLFTVFFLAFAAYIFNSQRRCRYAACLTMAFFAVSPLPILRLLAAVADVRFAWIWQAGIIASTVVMFRGVRTATAATERGDKGTGRWQA